MRILSIPSALPSGTAARLQKQFQIDHDRVFRLVRVTVNLVVMDCQNLRTRQLINYLARFS